MTSAQTIGLLNIEGIQSSLHYMPQGVYQDYCRWVLSCPEQSKNWLQLVGITGLSRLTFDLLQGLLTEEELEALIPYSVPINVFNMYEVISDNLSLGLAYRLEDDNTYDIRRHIVGQLNNAMVARLRGAEAADTRQIIANIPGLNEISVFNQSLNTTKHRAIATAFYAQHPEVDPKEIEYSFYPNLLANVEACNQVVKNLQGYLTQELVQKGFIRRYAGLNRLLDDTYIPRNYLLQIGANTIMVRPLLGYYIAVIAEEIRLIPYYDAIVENGVLLKALEDAAMLSRLLNDLGPLLLEQSETDRSELTSKLQQAQRQHQFESFRDLILYVADQSDHTLTRLKKDAKFGEFNLCLYEPYRSNSIPEAIDSFYDQLRFLSCVYKERWTRLQESLDIINSETHSTLISKIILRFLYFHDQMYRTFFDKPEGEYAI